ncbi:MAG TPA: AhpC/TSA family protein [Acidimicrobiia bacterium]|nr:AhpC/TSA family protein [Acidimicrobiia bacterium]
MLCREHAAQLRGSYDEITGRGAEVVAIGTGSVRHAAAFVADERIPFPVLVDDDARAARAGSVRRVGFFRLLTDRRSREGAKRARASGHRIHKAGRRVTQLGATFVIGPGDELRYEHLDDHSADHAPLEDVLSALPTAAAG